jgi:predicted RNA-binding Zn-ribbon protein involved in translation (DUF1610 family)
MEKHFIRCPNCGYEGLGTLWKVGCGPQLLEVFLFLCFIFPWLIYKGFTYSKLECPKCGNTKVVRV